MKNKQLYLIIANMYGITYLISPEGINKWFVLIMFGIWITMSIIEES